MLFSKIHRFQKTTSTNDEARKLASKGVSEGVCVVSEEQTHGRGRLQRKWYSERGNIYLSLILRPSIPAKTAPQLTYVAALAVKGTLKKYLGLLPELKWPNDVMVHRKKISGILTELETKNDKLSFVIIGIGLNVNQRVFPKEISNIATSLYQLLGRELSLNPLIKELLSCFEKWYSAYLKKGFSYIREIWEKESQILGREVVIQDGKKKIRGIAHGLNGDGALKIKSSKGRMMEIYSGDLICY